MLKRQNIDKEFIEREYLDGRTAKSISCDLGCSPRTVSNHLKDMGYQPSRRRYFFNQDFFKKIDKPEKAWLLGWIYSDGHIRENGKEVSIMLKSSDSYILRKFASALEYMTPIHVWENERACSVGIYSEQLISDLTKYIPKGRKSKIVTPPNLGKFQNSFWQGAWEGDGFIRKRGNALAIGLSGTEETCAGFRDFLGIDNKITKSRNTYTIEKSSIEKEYWRKKFEKLYSSELLVKDFYLRRKFCVWDDFLNN